jgi:DNA-binding NtrC family response regulator
MKTILYVDNSESHRFLLREALSEEGYEVFTSESIEDALSQFTGVKPDLLILELRQMDAKKENFRKLKEQYPGIPLIGYSTFTQCPGEFKEWIDFYLTKSPETDEIKSLVRVLSNLNQISQE